MDTTTTENNILDTLENNSIFLNNKDVDLTKISVKAFSRWLLQQDDSFKNSLVAIKRFLTENYTFIIGVNKISLTDYINLKDSFNQLTIKN